MAPLPPVSATSSPLSSPASFITATASPSNPADVTSTDISTPDDDGAELGYRKARQLPVELKQYCQIYLEENLHLIALHLLERMHSAGLGTLQTAQYGSQRLKRSGIYCPPPNQLALINTIAVHPDFTTRPREQGWPDASSLALNYQRNLLHTVGPLNGRFKEAFRFGTSSRWSRSGTPNSDCDHDMMDDASGDAQQLYGRYAKQSIWQRGQDFFSVVGWAFNCSVLYPNRWEHWREWLEFMFDLLEADLLERQRLDEDEHVRAGGANGGCAYPLLKDSILASYIKQRSGRSGGLKWITKAIFADGGKSSSSLFQEVWHKEHRGTSKRALNKRKREQVNIEKGEFGDLLDDNSVYSSQASEPPTPQKRRTNLIKHEFQALESAYVESVYLRQRLFKLLSYLCHFLPSPPLDLPNLYESYESEVRCLPISIFSAFIASTTSALRTDSQISILQDILSLFMPSSATSPARVNADCYNANGTSPAILERCFLPYAANTIAVEDNAKVSLLLEELVQLVWVNGTEQFSRGMFGTVMKGINAREAKSKKKVGPRGRRSGAVGGDDSDTEARAVLDDSSKRLHFMVALMMAEVDTDDTIEEEEEDDEEIVRSDLMEEVSMESSYMSARSS